MWENILDCKIDGVAGILGGEGGKKGGGEVTGRRRGKIGRKGAEGKRKKQEAGGEGEEGQTG